MQDWGRMIGGYLMSDGFIRAPFGGVREDCGALKWEVRMEGLDVVDCVKC